MIALAAGIGIGYLVWQQPEPASLPIAAQAIETSPPALQSEFEAPVALNDPFDPYGAVSDDCYGHVLFILRQVPQALRDGYDWVDTQSVSIEYGARSAEVAILADLQPELISNIYMNGSPDDQMLAILPRIEEKCGSR